MCFVRHTVIPLGSCTHYIPNGGCLVATRLSYMVAVAAKISQWQLNGSQTVIPHELYGGHTVIPLKLYGTHTVILHETCMVVTNFIPH